MNWAYTQKTRIQRHMHPNVHCGTIYDSQDMEAAKSSTEEWIKQMQYTLIQWVLLSKGVKSVETWMD